METPEAWLNAWRSLGQGPWPRGPEPGAPGPARVPGLADAAAAFTSFAEEFGRIARSATGAGPADAERLRGELEALAQNFFARAVPAWPTGSLPGAEWPAALQAFAMALADVARATAAAFAARLLGADPPATLRAAFDAWIDCAEAAFQSTAHSEAYAQAQARLFNELVRARARQQALVEQAAKSAGLPTRSEVDALHDELRALRSELAAARAKAPAAAPPPARRRARPRPKAPR